MVQLSNVMFLSAEQIRMENQAITRRNNEDAAWLGALWHVIDKRELWKEWGYDFFYKSIEGECSRGFSTIMECIANYRFFVIENAMDFEEYVALVTEQGTRKTSLIRRESESKITEVRLAEPDPDRPREESAQEQIRQVAQHFAPLTIQEARQEMAHTQTYSSVFVRFSFTPDQYELLQFALKHIREKRVGRDISPSMALALLVAEYCSEKAGREVVPEEALAA